MLLAIDVGNTNTVFAVFDGSTLIQSWRLQSQGRRTGDEYAAFLKQVFDLADLSFHDIEAVIVGSVVPEANMHIGILCEKYMHCEARFVSKDNVGIPMDVESPDEVGADRLVNAVAVLAHYSAPAIVIDFGTATTFDVVSAKGAYAGGIIAPGINLSIDALHQAASKLPKISVKKPQKVIGKTTVQAMHSGIYHGYRNLIEGLVRDIQKEMGGAPLVLATGGLASLFAQDSAVIQSVDQELTLKGLLEIHKRLQS